LLEAFIASWLPNTINAGTMGRLIGMEIKMKAANVFPFASHRAIAFLMVPFISLLFGLLSTQASENQQLTLVPRTKLKITVLQWISSKGEYQRWDPASGEFVISSEGTILLPLVGTIDVARLNTATIASQIAERIKSKTGLIEAPDTTVEVVEYPPVYVIGDIAEPGAKPFQPGLTVLQALSLSRGMFRPTTETGMKGQIGLLGDMAETRNDILRAAARISRLQAEMANENDIKFADLDNTNISQEVINEVLAQERIIFNARRSALERQLKNLSDLRNLLNGEIDNLEQKSQVVDANVKLVEGELRDVKSLVDRGIATVSRRSELERALALLRADRLDQITAAMRARQSLSEATRNEAGLRDQYQTDVSTELQQVQASLERFRIKHEVIQKTITVASTLRNDEGQTSVDGLSELSFKIVRKKEGQGVEIAASEATILQPDDVLKVTVAGRNKRPSTAPPVATYLGQ
jgi:protein involved in polysaccharide export with SLBB domain